MRFRLAVFTSAMLVVSGCASRPSAPSQDMPTSSRSVDQRMLTPEAAGSASKVERYRLAPSEVFRMPQPQDAPNPELPADSPRQTLASTTVCARVVIDAAGAVQRAEVLDDRSECAAGGQPDNADLVAAMLDKVRHWRFVPAALCRFAAGQSPAQPGQCEGAQAVEPVPVTLLYAFTFEVEQGRVRVERGGVGGP
jgi:hypothetical protein